MYKPSKRRVETRVRMQKVASIRKRVPLPLIGAPRVLSASLSSLVRKKLVQRLWQVQGLAIRLAELVLKISVRLLFFPNGLTNPLGLELFKIVIGSI